MCRTTVNLKLAAWRARRTRQLTYRGGGGGITRSVDPQPISCDHTPVPTAHSVTRVTPVTGTQSLGVLPKPVDPFIEGINRDREMALIKQAAFQAGIQEAQAVQRQALILEDRARIRQRSIPAFMPPKQFLQEATQREEGDRTQHWVQSLQDNPGDKEEDEYYSEESSQPASEGSSQFKDATLQGDSLRAKKQRLLQDLREVEEEENRYVSHRDRSRSPRRRSEILSSRARSVSRRTEDSYKVASWSGASPVSPRPRAPRFDRISNALEIVGKLVPDAFEQGSVRSSVKERVRELTPYGIEPTHNVDTARMLRTPPILLDTIRAMESGIPDQTSSAGGKLSFRVFKPPIMNKKISAPWLERRPDLPSDLSSILKPESSVKPPKEGFSHSLSDSLRAENYNMIQSASQADWLGVAASFQIKELINNNAEMSPQEMTEALSNLQTLTTEAAYVRMDLMTSLATSQVNMKMASRESVLKTVLPSFSKHALDLMNLPVSSPGLFPDGNKVINSWTDKVQLSTLAALANSTRPAKSSEGRGRGYEPRGGRGMKKKPYARTDRPTRGHTYPSRGQSSFRAKGSTPHAGRGRATTRGKRGHTGKK